MAIKDGLIPQFDVEIAGLRKTLERVPADKFDYKPHEKSFSMIRLAQHLATIPGWGHYTLTTDELDFSQPLPQPAVATNTDELLSILDKGAADARTQLEKATDEQLLGMWTLRNGENVIFSMTRVAVLRGMVLSHMIHHRGQLTVYLRLNDIPVPALYGPSADES